MFGGFKQTDDTQTGIAAVLRRPVVDDTIEKIPKLEFERFSRIDLWRPHIARAIADQQIVDTLAAADVNAVVSYLESQYINDITFNLHVGFGEPMG